MIQFIGQNLAVMLLRRRDPEKHRPYRIWLYPLPNLVALLGWIFIFATTDVWIILIGLTTLFLGIVFFFAWSWRTQRWPFKTH